MMQETAFIDLRVEVDKADALKSAVNNPESSSISYRSVSEFADIPGSPIAYSISPQVAQIFVREPKWEESGRSAHQGLATADNFRFVRSWWEVSTASEHWRPLSKGSNRVPFYCELTLVMNWKNDGEEMKTWAGTLYNNSHWSRIMMNYPLYFRAGITYSRRPHLRGWFQFLPAGCIFSTDSPIIVGRPLSDLQADAGILNSKIFSSLLGLLMARGTSGGQTLKYETGYVSSVPIPDLQFDIADELKTLSVCGFSLARSLEALDECSRYFKLPELLLDRDGSVPRINQLEALLEKIDQIALRAYSLEDHDIEVTDGSANNDKQDEKGEFKEDDDANEDGPKETLDQLELLRAWASGVAFGRFDWRLATGEREAPPEPEPFDPLPAESPGMLPEGALPFHAHDGILVEDQGHPHDLPRLIEEVLTRVDIEVPGDVRRWLQRDFFTFHLKQYSKSRRKAPIYWPLSTNSGSYTLWLYYPDLTSQTLYSAVNDFVEPKLTQISREADALRARGAARSREDEKAFEALQALELELIELRDTLLRIAPTYRPNHDDGVQVTAAPLWQLFRHKPWQKVLKDTWAKLEKGDYDWAHLAMAYWPDRVREKCKTDKSLAIAHDLEHLYVESEPKPTKVGGRGKRSGA
jgi:hypothetical protein